MDKNSSGDSRAVIIEDVDPSSSEPIRIPAIITSDGRLVVVENNGREENNDEAPSTAADNSGGTSTTKMITDGSSFEICWARLKTRDTWWPAALIRGAANDNRKGHIYWFGTGEQTPDPRITDDLVCEFGRNFNTFYTSKRKLADYQEAVEHAVRIYASIAGIEFYETDGQEDWRKWAEENITNRPIAYLTKTQIDIEIEKIFVHKRRSQENSEPRVSKRQPKKKKQFSPPFEQKFYCPVAKCRCIFSASGTLSTHVSVDHHGWRTKCHGCGVTGKQLTKKDHANKCDGAKALINRGEKWFAYVRIPSLASPGFEKSMVKKEESTADVTMEVVEEDQAMEPTVVDLEGDQIEPQIDAAIVDPLEEDAADDSSSIIDLSIPIGLNQKARKSHQVVVFLRRNPGDQHPHVSDHDQLTTPSANEGDNIFAKLRMLRDATTVNNDEDEDRGDQSTAITDGAPRRIEESVQAAIDRAVAEATTTSQHQSSPFIRATVDSVANNIDQSLGGKSSVNVGGMRPRFDHSTAIIRVQNPSDLQRTPPPHRRQSSLVEHRGHQTTIVRRPQQPMMPSATIDQQQQSSTMAIDRQGSQIDIRKRNLSIDDSRATQQPKRPRMPVDDSSRSTPINTNNNIVVDRYRVSTLSRTTTAVDRRAPPSMCPQLAAIFEDESLIKCMLDQMRILDPYVRADLIGCLYCPYKGATIDVMIEHVRVQHGVYQSSTNNGNIDDDRGESMAIGSKMDQSIEIIDDDDGQQQASSSVVNDDMPSTSTKYRCAGGARVKITPRIDGIRRSIKEKVRECEFCGRMIAGEEEFLRHNEDHLIARVEAR